MEVFADSLTLDVGFEGAVRSVQPVHLLTKFYHEAAIRGDNWDEPNSDAFVEILAVSTTRSLILSDEAGMVLSISPAAKLLPLLSEAQVDSLVVFLTDQDGTKGRHL